MSFAFLFPGQGSQSVGMLAELAAEYPQVRQTFDEAGEALGENLWQLVCDGPDTELNRTEQTQPALLTAAIACWRVWQSQTDVLPTAVAGHSLGEYSALVVADVLDFPDAVRLVRKRAQLMQTAVPEGQGAMAALIGLNDAAVKQLCAELAQAAGKTLQAVNFNAPGQVVIAGESGLVEQAMEQAQAAGARMAKRLPISVPCHSDLLKEAADELAHSMEAIPMRNPRIPVIHNIDAQPRHEVDDIRRAMAKQLYSPVLWTDCIAQLQAMNIELLVECGPGRVLSGLNRRIERSLQSASLHNVQGLQAAIAQVQE